MLKDKAQIVYLSHGGGPMPILGDPSHEEMIKFMKKLPLKLKKPDLIIVISAHWEENVVTIQGAKNPSMIYDYYGFPEESYKINYPALGSSVYTNKIKELLDRHNIDCVIDDNRGFDHGLYIPLMMMYPNADVPTFQISLTRDLNAEKHIDLGKALAELSVVNDNILIIGSGFSIHNMSLFSTAGNRQDSSNDAFQDWLIEVCTSDLSKEEKEKRLVDWENAPSARYCHPRSEHLLPLHVCFGAAKNKAKLIFDDYIIGKRAVAFLWE